MVSMISLSPVGPDISITYFNSCLTSKILLIFRAFKAHMNHIAHKCDVERHHLKSVGSVH